MPISYKERIQKVGGVTTPEGVLTGYNEKYPLINNKGEIQLFNSKGKGKQISMAEHCLNVVKDCGELSEKERLRVPNFRFYLDGWRELTQAEFETWIETGKPFKLNVSPKEVESAFKSQLNEKEKEIEKLRAQLAEKKKGEKVPHVPVEPEKGESLI